MVDLTVLIGQVSPQSLLLFLITVFITMIFGSIVATLSKNYLRKKVKRPWHRVISKLLSYLIYFIGIYYGLHHILGFSLTTLITTLGVMSVAIAFSVQQIVQNIIAGAFIIGEGTIRLNDWVEIGGWPKTGLCQVKDIGLTKTTLREADGRLITVPNSVFMTQKIAKYPRGDFFKIPLEISVLTKNDLKKIEKIVNDICSKNEQVLPNIPEGKKPRVRTIIPRLHLSKKDVEKYKPKIFVKSITDSVVMLEIWIWIWNITKKEKIVSDLLNEILVEFKKKKIKLA